MREGITARPPMIGSLEYTFDLSLDALRRGYTRVRWSSNGSHQGQNRQFKFGIDWDSRWVRSQN
jgi:hypothetical protein